ncbi:hypothetical protein GCM10023093_22110 [Nemorincola caseinilytica]|uniref:Uncharacterized protein n=1 Tax=Nemorincola caseinilytica TaxID=2054315 RepID=A0ABP8NGK2_9BACT
MCQSSSKNCCQDYSLQTANTGIDTVSSANPALNGTGNTVSILTAGGIGATIRSVSIKAIAPVTAGMVRLFIKKGTAIILYKEVPVPVTPVLQATPTPTPLLPMFETVLTGDLKLAAGDELVASTQTKNAFNIFVEGLDWVYPEDLPTDCCNFRQVTAETGMILIDKANPNLDGSGTIDPVFTASATANGSHIKSITIKALQSTSINGAIRIFISNDGGTSFYLMKEVMVPQTTQSAYEPSYKQVIDMDYYLAPGYVIGVTTQNAEAFGITVESEAWSYPIS